MQHSGASAAEGGDGELVQRLRTGEAPEHGENGAFGR